MYISLPRDEDGYPPYEVEELRAEPLGGGRHRILGIPVFAYGLAVGDVVRVARVLGDRRLWVTEVAEPAELALKTLQAGFGAGRWDFDLGVAPPA